MTETAVLLAVWLVASGLIFGLASAVAVPLGLW